MNPKRPKINETSIGLGANSIIDSTNGGETNASIRKNMNTRALKRDKLSNQN